MPMRLPRFVTPELCRALVIVFGVATVFVSLVVPMLFLWTAPLAIALAAAAWLWYFSEEREKRLRAVRRAA